MEGVPRPEVAGPTGGMNVADGAGEHDRDATTGHPRPHHRSPTVGRRLLRLRMPVWLGVLLVVLVAAGAVALFVSRSVSLGPGVDGAVEVDASLTVCNETVDRRRINPRTAELDFEEGLRELGAKEADVRITRIDCGRQAP